MERPRPPGLPLQARIRQLRKLAAAPGAGGDRIVHAAEVCNKAALIASDCGRPDLARALCWRQHELFQQAWPLPASAGTLALQPVLNVPRQLIREGDGDGAYAMLQALYDAARDRTNTVIDGHSVDLRRVTRAPDDHRTTCTTVWAALLADGTRALARAGRWQEAAERAATRRGIGARLLDGRQITILALAQSGQSEQAATLVEQSTATEPWERALHHLLSIHCYRMAGADVGHRVPTMLTAVLALLRQRDPYTAVFRLRTGLVAFDLAGAHGEIELSQLREALIAMAHSDTYAARDALTHPQLRQAMTADQHRGLAKLTDASGLDTGTIPEPLYGDLMSAVSSAEKQLRAFLEDSVAVEAGE